MKVVLIAAVSVDGKIAQRADQSSLDWTSKEDLKFFVEKTKEIGTIVMGRKTFATIGKPLKDRRLIVMTSDPASQTAMEGVEYTSEDPKVILEQLITQGVERVAICGGAGVYTQFLASGLVTELFLTIEPVMFGTGVPLAEGFERINLSLVDMRLLNLQSLLLHYQVL